MEYNKTKGTLEKVAGILGIISASLFIILAIFLLIEAGMYFTGEYDYRFYDYDAYGEIYYYTVDATDEGIPYLMLGLPLLGIAILMLIFSIKLVKSPFLPNGELRNKKAARIWVLVLSILTGDLVVMGLMIAVLCLKDYKEPRVQQPINAYAPNGYNIQQPAIQNEFYAFYDKIQEVKKLKSLGIIDETAFRKAVTKIVVDITKE